MSNLGRYSQAGIETITGDVGAGVPPIIGNINLVGGPGVVVTGDPLTATLTITTAAGVSIDHLKTDVGGPVSPDGAGDVDLNGGYNITTNGTVANTVTFNLSGTTNHCVQIGNVTNSLTSMAVGQNGQTIMGSTGADPGWTSSPQFGGSVTALNDISSTAGSISSLSGSVISRDATNTATGPSIYFEKVRVAAIIQSGDAIGTLRYTGYDGVGYITGAKITSTTSGTIAVNRVASDLKFWTHPDSVIALPSEPITRMTIGPAGNVTIAAPDAGTALTIDNGGLTVTVGTTQSPTIRTGDPAVLAAILSANAATITTNGTAANVDLTVTPKGTGNFNFTGNTGTAMVFRGITPGSWTDIDWHTEQHVHQTINTFAPEAIFSLVIPAKRMVTIKATVNGFQNDYSDVVGGEILVTAYRDNAGGNLLLAGAPIINVNYSSLVDTSDINAGISGVDTINIYVVGVVAQTWNWAATIQYMYTVDNS